MPWRQGVAAYERQKFAAEGSEPAHWLGRCSDEVHRQAGRTQRAYEAWNMAGSGTQAERAARSWYQAQMDTLRAMLAYADRPATEVEVQAPPVVVRRLSWRSLWDSKAADYLLCVLGGLAFAALVSGIIVLVGGGWGR